MKEKKAYSDYEMMIKKKSLELEKFLSKLKEKENKINDYDSIIKQAEQTYQRVRIIFFFFLNSNFLFSSSSRHPKS